MEQNINLEKLPSNQIQGQTFTYFSLIQNVGTKGKYQSILFIITMTYFFMNALTTSNSAFIFLNPEFDCYSKAIITDNCEQYVCNNYPQTQIYKFPRKIQYATIATQFGPFYCQDNLKLGLYMGIQSIGACVGIFAGIIFSDNISRKYVFVICCSLCTFGLLLLSLSPNIEMTLISLLIVGLGDNVCLKISQAMISEQTEKNLSKKYISLTLIPFSVASLILGQIFALSENWRVFTFYFCFLPFLLLTICVILFVEDSPKFLLKRSEQQAIQSLNRIAKLNNRDLGDQIKKQLEYGNIQHHYSPYDMFRYQSLRLASVNFCFIFFCLEFFFYAQTTLWKFILSLIISYYSDIHWIQISFSIPAYVALIDKIGFGEVVNGYLFGIGGIIGIIISFLFSTTIQRKKTGIIAYSIMSFLYFSLIFLQVSDKCYQCSNQYLQMIAIIVAYVFLNLSTSLLYIQLVQYYPVSIRNIGCGMPKLCGAVGIFCSQFLIVGAFQISKRLPFVLMSSIALIGTINYGMAPETLNMQPKDQIQEIEQLYNKQHEENKRQ